MTDTASLNLIVGSRHVTAAALAYLYRSLVFERVIATEDDQAVIATPTRIMQLDRARVQMAGGAAEFEHWVGVHGQDEAIRQTVEGWVTLLDLETPGEYDWDSPEALAAGALSSEFAWTVAFYRSNQQLIEDMAAELLNRGGALTHDELIDAIDGRDIVPATVDAEWEITAALVQHTETIRKVEEHLIELQTLRND